MTEKGEALSFLVPSSSRGDSPPFGAATKDCSLWFAIQTRPRHEKKVNSELCEKGIHSFLPLRCEKRRWTDRSKWVELPMFSQYLFVRMPASGDARLRVLQTRGVVKFVGTNGRGTAVPDEQMEGLLAIVSRRIPTAPHEFLHVGQRVRIRGGALDGIEGILSAIQNEKSLVVSVDPIQKAIAIRISGFEVEPA